jgi:nicotinic acid mononucleotide adenylyltransferase
MVWLKTYAVEKYGADEGIFISTNDAYLSRKVLLKTKSPSKFILPEAVRAEMLRSLATDNPKLTYWGSEVGGIDAKTYETLKKLLKDKQKQYPGEEIKLYFLFGADKLRGMPRWRHAQEMSDLCEYLIYARQFNLDEVIENDAFLASRCNRIHLLQVENEDLEDVSSTEVRRRFFAGEDYSELMNDGPYKLMQTLSPSDFSTVLLSHFMEKLSNPKKQKSG